MTQSPKPKVPPGAQEALKRPTRRKPTPSLDWEVVTLREDRSQPWKVTTLRIVPVVHPKMPDQLKIATERYRELVRSGGVGNDEVLAEIIRWREMSGEED